MSNISIKQPKISSSLAAVAWVPGMPHIVDLTEKHKDYQALKAAGEAVGAHIKATGSKRILYFSTQWISVLGQSFQARADLRGRHVDENWYELPNLDFSFQVDVTFAKNLAKTVKETGLATQLVDYDGFPVDTGTIIADRMVNPSKLPVGIISCHVYSDYAATRRLFQTIAKAIEADKVPTAVVIVSQITTNFFTTEMDVREDRIRDTKDQEWMNKLLGAFEKGDMGGTDQVVQSMNQSVKTDMGLKGFAAVGGLFNHTTRSAQVLAQGAAYGSGNAVVLF